VVQEGRSKRGRDQPNVGGRPDLATSELSDAVEVQQRWRRTPTNRTWKFCLDNAELAAITQCGGKLFKRFFPNFFVLGTSGGNEAIALDSNVPAPYPVVRFDMTNCNLVETVKRLSPDFDTFLNLVRHTAG
jgi:hypothetical protein